MKTDLFHFKNILFEVCPFVFISRPFTYRAFKSTVYNLAEASDTLPKAKNTEAENSVANFDQNTSISQITPRQVFFLNTNFCDYNKSIILHCCISIRDHYFDSKERRRVVGKKSCWNSFNEAERY